MALEAKPKRNQVLDVIKGLAIICMIIAHGENIFNDGRWSVLTAFDVVGSTLAFTLFVFASGMASYYAYVFKEISTSMLMKKLLKRGSIVYIVFLILAFAALSVPRLTNNSVILWTDILLLRNLPYYTEYLIPLILLPVWVLLIRKIPKILDNIISLLLVAICIYIIGLIGSQAQWSEGVRPYAWLLFGSKDAFRFPILQYSSIYLVGLWFGRFYHVNNEKQNYRRTLGQIVLLIMFFIIDCVILSSDEGIKQNFFLRWPPGPGFLLLGVGVAIGVFYISAKLSQGWLARALASCGRASIVIYIGHIAFLLLYLKFINYQFANAFFGFIAIVVYPIFSILIGRFLANIFTKPMPRNQIWSIIVGVFLMSSVFGLVYIEQQPKSSVQGISDEKQLILTPTNVIEKEVLPNMRVISSRKWCIKHEKLTVDYTICTIDIQLDKQLPQDKSIAVLFTDNVEIREFATNKIDDMHYQFKVDTKEWRPGRYSYKAVIKGTLSESPSQMLNVSLPLFVTWTIDWEGYDVADKNLEAMGDLADEYQVPMTQMFNPRIFIATDINAQRKKAMTEWVLDRNSKGDEIALHMHMNLDMITSIGMTPKTTPSWGGRTNGHDVLTTAYTYNEFTQMLVWAKAKFEENGLPEPVSYRAGGWFIGLEQLRALQDNGFILDSSGRKSYVWGPNKQVGLWKLTETTMPYQPSKTNQNKSATGNSALSIWEFPNNGMDSTNNDTRMLKQAFDSNYRGQPLKQTQTLTYLSHANEFAKSDAPRMKALLEYIKVYKAEDDLGPVFYQTLEQSYNFWQ